MTDIAVTFIEPEGFEKMVEVAEGTSLMEAALFNGVEGIQGLCGGICSCATCHVALEPALYQALPQPEPGEAEMIDALDDHEPTSRLGCQVRINETLRGARVRVIGTQA